MENKGTEHISEKGLDSLLNQAFLNIDFDHSTKNKDLLRVVSRHTMSKNSPSAFYLSRKFNGMFFVVCLLACLSSFYRYMRFSESEPPTILRSTPITGKLTQKQPLLFFPQLRSLEKIHSESLNHIKVREPHKKHISGNDNIKQRPKENAQQASFNIRLMSNSNVVDSTVAKNKFILVSDTTISKKTDSSKSINPVKPRAVALVYKNPLNKRQSQKQLKHTEVKAKTEKRRNRRVFRRDGTFKMQGRKYGKSR